MLYSIWDLVTEQELARQSFPRFCSFSLVSPADARNFLYGINALYVAKNNDMKETDFYTRMQRKNYLLSTCQLSE